MSRIPDASIIHSRLRLRQLRLMLALEELGSLRRAAARESAPISGVTCTQKRSPSPDKASAATPMSEFCRNAAP